MNAWVVSLVALIYLTVLFVVAALGDRGHNKRAERDRPIRYALSLAVYCTSWTFFGSVGVAANSGLQFLTIYIGPALVFILATPFIKRITRISKAERITSIADFLASRYGKSFSVASIATLIATIGVVPYIALQLKAISDSVTLLAETRSVGAAALPMPIGVGGTSFWVTVLLAIFAILFGTRQTDATEHQDGLVFAIAIESVIKLAAFLIVGFSVCFLLFDPSSLWEQVSNHPAVWDSLTNDTPVIGWFTLTLLSGSAILLLPRQFYVMVVENRSEREVERARWLFPLYLVAINIFVLPIALVGLTTVGGQTNADLYVLAIPLLAGNEWLSIVAFIGGLSAATAMVIMASVALSIMISNDLIMPVVLHRTLGMRWADHEDWSRTILFIRRLAIAGLLAAGYFYYRSIDNAALLASIGLLSFAAIAQFMPAFLGGMVWRGANGRGAIAGMTVGFFAWSYTLLLPSILPPDAAMLVDGPFGLSWLRPEALFGLDLSSLEHGTLISLTANTLAFIIGSLSRSALPRERIQAALFVPRGAGRSPFPRKIKTQLTVGEIQTTIGRYLGQERTERSFRSWQQRENRVLQPSDIADAQILRFAEGLLGSAVGSSSARLILSLLLERYDTNASFAYTLLDDATEALQQNRGLLQIALDQMEQGITVFDRDLRLTCWNRRFRTLFNLPESLGVVGAPLSDVIEHLAGQQEIEEREIEKIIDRLACAQSAWQLELRRSGRIIEIRTRPMPEGGVVGTYTDITAQVESDRALKSANEGLEAAVAARTRELLDVNGELVDARRAAEDANLGKTRFLAAVGHDILQPLNAARLYCSAIGERTQATEQIPKDLPKTVQRIDASLNAVEDILSAVLDISRLDTGALTANVTTFRLGDVLQHVATALAPLAEAKGLKLHVIASSVLVDSDINLLRRLVQNLVSNAIKYTRSGRVLLGVRRRGDDAEIQVLDTGIGMAEDQLSAIFDEFARLEEGAREAEGLGLGLSIVDRIARVLNLEVAVRSRPGDGTNFAVVLPISKASQPSKSLSQPRSLIAARNFSDLRILTIDNEPDILDGMELLLKGWGCTVQRATGSDGIRALPADNPPNLILADYHLNGETGFDAIDNARQWFDREISAVLITADRSKSVMMEAADRDIPMLNKPVKPAKLRLIMNRQKKTQQAAAE
ncbi:PAS domain-containing hybrid sensor histidine kinase/response regulator [Notoacmeibacter sp. MSK16QG-6]|uniref:PAS domain-containing hybrid sensor histidine kinase/response regulator n=1 Tax=Notoacmeibacter sp. MSK16QG-6 TaxID=2957982 RepID=UPI00209E8AE1|nr:PAS domain-containing hybrid sensor histidine kinase/response regulator [Notoacmeibacter sp. MSK16QG-6]MCP1198594.1 hybrid sensor histidine kinase/response regulator [Notoacmeibacter sp. MSK16QG-6]